MRKVIILRLPTFSMARFVHELGSMEGDLDITDFVIADGNREPVEPPGNYDIIWDMVHDTPNGDLQGMVEYYIHCARMNNKLVLNLEAGSTVYRNRMLDQMYNYGVSRRKWEMSYAGNIGKNMKYPYIVRRNSGQGNASHPQLVRSEPEEIRWVDMWANDAYLREEFVETMQPDNRYYSGRVMVVGKSLYPENVAVQNFWNCNMNQERTPEVYRGLDCLDHVPVLDRSALTEKLRDARGTFSLNLGAIDFGIDADGMPHIWEVTKAFCFEKVPLSDHHKAFTADEEYITKRVYTYLEEVPLGL